MRILCVSAQKPDSTGSGVYLAETARAFVSAGHEVMVVAGLDVRDTPDLPEGARLEAVRFNTSDLPFPVVGMSDAMPYEATRYRDMTPAMLERFYAAFEGVLARAYADFLPDLVICHHLYLVTALTVRLAPPCPVTAVCHSTDMRQMRSHGLEREAVTAGVRQLDRIFALHDEQKAEIVEFYGVDANRIVVVGTGYNAQVFCPRDVQNRHQGPLRIAYAGKICRKKGLESLIAALDLLPFSPDELEAVLVGGNGSREEVARIAERAARSRYQVSLPGRVSQDDLVDLYRTADVFVLPSFFEGLPLVLVEALACGCRVVTTDLPVVRPWLSAALPASPVEYVAPPRMEGVDEPIEEDLPAFERALAAALERSLVAARDEGPATTDARALSWEALVVRMLAACGV